MGKLDVDPPRLAGAGRGLDAKTDALVSAVQALETALSSSGQMCGNDAAGKAFALSYRQGGQALFSAAESAVNACRNVGYGIEVSASNYAQSEAASRIGGGEPSVQPPSQPSKFSGPTMPNPFGPAVGEPMLWAIVREFVGSPWPDGNPETLRAAAGAWRSFGGAITGVSGAVGGCSSELSGHDIPELAKIIDAVTKLGSGVGDLEKQCESIASSLDSFAGEVEASQQAIRDLLDRLSLSGILDELGSILSGHNPWDDVKKVANDIKQILHTLGREADASSSLFQAAMSELDTLTTQFEDWARKEFVHFLGNKVGNGFADLYNSDVDILEGGVKSLLETVGSLGDLATHPQKLLDLAKQANPEYQIANFVANPKAAFEHNLDVVKGLVDAKDWNSDHPLRGFGDNIGTGLQFLIPGAGEAKAGAEGARAADEAAQAARTEGKAADGLFGSGLKSDVAGQSSKIAHDLDGIKATPAEPGAVKPADPGAVRPGEPAPAGRPTDPAPPGRPADLGAAKPAEPGAAKPAEPGTTVRATDPATGGGAGAHEPAPVGSGAAAGGGAHEPAHVGSAAAPAEHAPTAAPHVPDSTAAQVPVAPEGSLAEHAAGSSHPAPGPHPGGADARGMPPHDLGRPGGGGDGGGGLPPSGDAGGHGSSGPPSEPVKPAETPHEHTPPSGSPPHPGRVEPAEGARPHEPARDGAPGADHTRDAGANHGHPDPEHPGEVGDHPMGDSGDPMRDWPTDDSGYRIAEEDLKFLGLDAEQVGWWQHFEAPLGMTPEQFKEFTGTLHDALIRDGLDAEQVDVRLQGSSAQFFSGPHKNFPTEFSLADQPEAQARLHEWMGDRAEADRPARIPFDAMERLGVRDAAGERAPLSDYDIQLSSDDMVEKARQAWEDMDPADRRPQLMHPKYDFADKGAVEAAFPELYAWKDRWEELLGREVEPALFGSDGPPDKSGVGSGISTHFRDRDWIINRPEGRR